MAPRHLPTLLAMPASLRPMLLAAFTPASRSCWLPQRGFHASYPNFAKYRPMRQPLKVGAFTIPHSPALPISQVPLEQLLESPKHNGSLIDDLRTLFTKNPATFYHGTSDFYTLKKNTRVPEICVLGRSNVGKSTLVNAIANRREKELAHTSSKAGRTRAMNAFGFGPAPTMKELADTSTEVKRTEDLPKHSLFIVDMPGYGHRSLKDWGRNINLYLHKRQSVKGAVVLIDGEVGPKSTDLVALDLLCEAGVRTAIVLTKADKARDEAMLLNTCQELWNTLRDIQFKHLESGWQWEKDIFVTAVGATKKEVGADTVDVARLVIARLAGLVDEKVRPEQEAAKKYSGKIVSFDDLQYAPITKITTNGPTSSNMTTPAPSPTPASKKSHPAPRAASPFDALERASATGRTPPRKYTPAIPNWGSHNRVQTRALHTSAPRNRNSKSDPNEINDILKDFVFSLQANSNYDHPPKQKRHNHHKIFNPLQREQERRWKTSMKKEAANKDRFLDIFDRRLEREETKKYIAEERARKKAEEALRWPNSEPKERDEGTFDAPMDADAFAEAFGDFGEQRELKGKKAKKAKKEAAKATKGKNKNKGPEKEPDEFEAKFATALNKVP